MSGGGYVAPTAGRHAGDEHRRQACRSSPSSRWRSRSPTRARPACPPPAVRWSRWIRKTGRVLAAASYPTYDPQQFVGGISTKNYAGAHRTECRRPAAQPRDRGRLRARLDVQAHHVVLAGDAQRDLHRPASTRARGSVTIDGRVKTNYDSEILRQHRSRERARLLLRHVLLRARGERVLRRPGAHRRRQEARTSSCSRWPPQFGVGADPGIDLPAGEQAAGSYADRETRLARWKANKAQSTAPRRSAVTPDIKSPNAARLPDPARLGELHRRLALPRRRQRRHGDRAGRDDDVAAAVGGRLLGAGQRRPDLEPRARLGDRRTARARSCTRSIRRCTTPCR